MRVVGADGEQVGILTIEEALARADEVGLDLVEVSPNSNPPVCKIMNYGKYRYEVSKKEKQTRKKQHVIHVKEIRMRPKIESHDFDFKVKHARKFIEEGNKVKVTVLFKGREMVHREFGSTLLERLTTELEDIAKVERAPQMEGRTLTAYFIKK